MVTATDDQSDRLTALETSVSELRSEIQADIRALTDRQDRFQADMQDRLDHHYTEMTDRLDRFQAESNARIDALGARIERVFWAVIAVGLLIGAMLTLVFRLS